jgi:hypothetical protein
MAMPRALVTSAAAGEASIDQPDHPPGRAVQDHRAVELALAGGMLGDIGDPQLVRPAAGEGAVDQVGGDLVGLGMAPPCAGQADAAYQQRNAVVADHDPAAQPQLGMPPQSAVGATRALVDLGDAVGEPDMADGPRRWRPDRQA